MVLSGSASRAERVLASSSRLATSSWAVRTRTRTSQIGELQYLSAPAVGTDDVFLCQ
jgi:hypothetical protein